ncbi:MAG: hypothetical protein N2202_05690 [Proteobacteria bacterium]|nr:hypothetical protein [Pseudomonadota bacterium]
MKKIILLIMIVLLSLPACKKKQEVVVSENRQSEIFNISQFPEIKKMQRLIATFENYEKKTKLIQSPNMKDIFVTINFPFSYKIVESYVSKGKYVKKGDKLFLIQSDELVDSYKNYLKTNDPTIREKLLSIGIDLNIEPSKETLIVSPDEGTIVFIGDDKEAKSLTMQNTLAIIQKKGELIFNLLIPKESYTDETYFYALLKEKLIPMQLVSSEEVGNSVKVTLSLKGFDVNDQLQNVEIQVVNVMQNIFKIPKDAILQMGNEHYCFVESAQDIVEKRYIEGFIEGDNFIVTSGLRQTEKIIIGNAERIKNILKIKT